MEYEKLEFLFDSRKLFEVPIQNTRCKNTNNSKGAKKKITELHCKDIFFCTFPMVVWKARIINKRNIKESNTHKEQNSVANGNRLNAVDVVFFMLVFSFHFISKTFIIPATDARIPCDVHMSMSNAIFNTMNRSFSKKLKYALPTQTKYHIQTVSKIGLFWINSWNFYDFETVSPFRFATFGRKMIKHQTICDASNECFLLISRKFSHLMHISRSSFIIAVLTASSRRRVMVNWKAFFCSAFGITLCSNDDSPPRKMIEWFLSCVYHDKWESVLSRMENEAQQSTTRKNALDN